MPRRKPNSKTLARQAQSPLDCFAMNLETEQRMAIASLRRATRRNASKFLATDARELLEVVAIELGIDLPTNTRPAAKGTRTRPVNARPDAPAERPDAGWLRRRDWRDALDLRCAADVWCTGAFGAESMDTAVRHADGSRWVSVRVPHSVVCDECCWLIRRGSPVFLEVVAPDVALADARVRCCDLARRCEPTGGPARVEPAERARIELELRARCAGFAEGLYTEARRIELRDRGPAWVRMHERVSAANRTRSPGRRRGAR